MRNSVLRPRTIRLVTEYLYEDYFSQQFEPTLICSLFFQSDNITDLISQQSMVF